MASTNDANQPYHQKDSQQSSHFTPTSLSPDSETFGRFLISFNNSDESWIDPLQDRAASLPSDKVGFGIADSLTLTKFDRKNMMDLDEDYYIDANADYEESGGFQCGERSDVSIISTNSLVPHRSHRRRGVSCVHQQKQFGNYSSPIVITVPTKTVSESNNSKTIVNELDVMNVVSLSESQPQAA